MTSVINLFLPLFIVVFALYWVARGVDRLVLRQLGKGWYLALTWPGVVVHELSHLIACIFTLTKVYRVHLFWPSGDTLGFVEHAQSHNPLKNVIISIAPLFGVSAVLWGLSRWLVPELTMHQLIDAQSALADFSSFQRFFSFTGDFLQQLWSSMTNVFSLLDFHAWQTYLFCYVMLVTSSHAAPSRVDLKHTSIGLVGLVLLFWLIVLVDGWLQVPITWNVARWLAKPIYFLVHTLGYGLLFSVSTLVLLLPITLASRILRRGRQ